MNPFEQHGIGHLSPSSCNMFASEVALWVMERLLKRKAPVGAAAHRGTASEEGIVAGLLDPTKTVEECQEIASKKFRELTALSGDPSREKEGAAVPQIVGRGLTELRPYGVPSAVQGKINHTLDGIEVPVIGYYDVCWEQHGILIDIKTALRLASQIKTGHARQVSLYQAAVGGDNLSARVSYITPAKVATYHLENYREHLNALHKIALTMRRFLALSSDPHELAGLVSPDVDSFYYSDPRARQHCFEVYGF